MRSTFVYLLSRHCVLTVECCGGPVSRATKFHKVLPGTNLITHHKTEKHASAQRTLLDTTCKAIRGTTPSAQSPVPGRRGRGRRGTLRSKPTTQTEKNTCSWGVDDSPLTHRAVQTDPSGGHSSRPHDHVNATTRTTKRVQTAQHTSKVHAPRSAHHEKISGAREAPRSTIVIVSTGHSSAGTRRPSSSCTGSSSRPSCTSCCSSRPRTACTARTRRRTSSPSSSWSTRSS